MTPAPAPSVPLRIVMVAHAFPRREGDVAGAFLWRLAEALIDRGHQVSAVAPADHGDVGEPLLGRVPVHRFRYAEAGRESLAYQGTMHVLAASPLGAWTFARLLGAMRRASLEEVRRTDAHILHTHWWVPGALATRGLTRPPQVITLHGTDVRLAGRVPLAGLAMRSVLRRAAAVTAVSTYLAERAARALAVSVETVAVTPMPLVSTASPESASAGEGVVFVGRLTRQKGVHLLIDALATLRQRGTPLTLTVVGDGPERPELEARARQAGLAATFAGAVPPGEVPRRLRGRRVFVLPALEEGLGLVVAEALSQGVPVVATRSGGIPDLLTDPDAGVLVPPGDAAALADAIATVARDPRFLAGAARAGRALAARLSPDAAAGRVEAVYRSVLAR